MTTTYATRSVRQSNPASEKQKTFITDLLARKVLPNGHRAQIDIMLKSETFKSREASLVIESLLKLKDAPKAVTFTPAGTVAPDPVQEMLATIPKAKYAVPAMTANLLMGRPTTNDYAFFAVTQTRKGRYYIRQIVGAPGAFASYSMGRPAELALAKFLTMPGEALTATQKFGELYSCCGKCDAPLTDEKSRELKLGPVCRKSFGL